MGIPEDKKHYLEQSKILVKTQIENSLLRKRLSSERE